MAVRILLVDDSPLVLDLLRRGLEPHAKVEAATDGTDALLKALESPPDLVISDYRMGGLDGRQLLEKLRAKPQTQKVPVVLLATKTDVDERLQGISDQVEDFFIKPFFVRDLTKRAKRIIDRIHLEKMQRESAARGGGFAGRLSEMASWTCSRPWKWARRPAPCRLPGQTIGKRQRFTLPTSKSIMR